MSSSASDTVRPSVPWIAADRPVRALARGEAVPRVAPDEAIASMLRRRMRSPLLLALAALALLAPGSGCRRKIGDPCIRSTDCSLQGERICDLSTRVNSAGQRSPSGRGECTIEGCGRGSCPKEAECVKVYGADFLSVACDPGREDIATFCTESDEACAAAGCLPSAEDESVYVCPPIDVCNPSEVCLAEGLCADEITARTSCRKECKNGDDCRAGYECRRTGSDGVYRAPDFENPDDRSEVKICMPVP
jgi:hypothetical protein